LSAVIDPGGGYAYFGTATSPGIVVRIDLGLMYLISGYVRTSGGAGIGNVVMSGLPGDPSTNSSGYYSAFVDHGWSGTATPQKSGYSFDPTNRLYSTVVSNQNNQDYIAIRSYISYLPLILR
jgi:hypothetical protein